MTAEMGHNGKKADVECFLVCDSKSKSNKFFFVIKGEKVGIISILVT